jgi:hypothetical protein
MPKPPPVTPCRAHPRRTAVNRAPADPRREQNRIAGTLTLRPSPLRRSDPNQGDRG